VLYRDGLSRRNQAKADLSRRSPAKADLSRRSPAKADLSRRSPAKAEAFAEADVEFSAINRNHLFPQLPIPNPSANQILVCLGLFGSVWV
jgi:hypothetical protein